MILNPLDTLTVLTVVRILIGTGMIFVLAGSLYKFKRAILTTMGTLLLLNLICLYITMGLLS